MRKLKVYNRQNNIAVFSTDNFYKVVDVEPILNSYRQLKNEIAAMEKKYERCANNWTTTAGNVLEDLRQLTSSHGSSAQQGASSW